MIKFFLYLRKKTRAKSRTYYAPGAQITLRYIFFKKGGRPFCIFLFICQIKLILPCRVRIGPIGARNRLGRKIITTSIIVTLIFFIDDVVKLKG